MVQPVHTVFDANIGAYSITEKVASLRRIAYHSLLDLYPLPAYSIKVTGYIFTSCCHRQSRTLTATC